jgi:hypothetical protein
VTITYNHRYPTNIDEVRSNFQSLLGNDIIIFQRKNGQTYCNPIRTKVRQIHNNQVLCSNKHGKRECFKYVDFYNGDLVFDRVEVCR